MFPAYLNSVALSLYEHNFIKGARNPALFEHLRESVHECERVCVRVVG